MANNIKINGSIDLSVNANVESAKAQLMELQKSLKQVSNIELNVKGSSLSEEIQKASQSALELSSHLTNATNIKTGQIDFPKLQSTLKASGKSLQEYAYSLAELGPQGKKAFLGLANSIAQAEIPLKRTNKLIDKAWDGLKRQVGWTFSSSIIHGLMGSIQQAMGYAQDLNKSLTDIRIVTGASSDQMASFAKEANAAAKALNTTTTDYTKAALIYYQQGLSEADVKARTETTLKMANVTGTSAKEVSNQMTAIWNNYDNGTKSLEYYADAMAALGAKTASSTDEIAQGLQKFASISNTVGLSYEYAASALATITSTSRESADVVGNALKTLFSRIQGLQLGETLDDGTTLNKYSASLASVGINIKDASGQLKDMDVILDEMGMTWNTLAKDEKMALAQTVAGVRQYTQLITLMDNWSFFKENVQTAQSSRGTLDAQAAIFAESWQAASNQVRASWEGLWDNLINSDSFISILEGFSGLIEMVDSLITGMGGAGGVLASFGGILLHTFSPQITKNIKEIGYNLSAHMPGFRDKKGAEKSAIITEMNDIIQSGTFESGPNESRVIKDNLSSMAANSALREQRLANMTPQERIYAEELETKMQNSRTRREEIAREMDLLNGNLVGIEDTLGRGTWESEAWGASAIKDAESAIAETQKQIQANNEHLPQNRDPKKKPEEGWKNPAQVKQENAELYKQIAQKNAEIQGIKGRGTKQDVYDSTAKAATQFKEQFEKEFWDNIGQNNGTVDKKRAKDNIKKLMKANGMIFSDDDYEKAFADMEGSSDSQARFKIRELVEKTITDTFTQTATMGETDETKQQAAVDWMKNRYGYETLSDESSGHLTALNKNQQTLDQYNEPKPDKMQGAVDAAAAASSLLAVTQSADALGEAFGALGTEAGSFGDTLAAGIGTITSIIQTMVFTGNAMSNLIPALQGISILGMSAGGFIGLALSAVTAIVSGISGYKKEQEELQKQAHERALEEGKEAKERLEKNKELTDSLNENIVALEQMTAAQQRGEASSEDVREARQDLLNQISESGENFSAEAVSNILTGNLDAAQDQIFADRHALIEQNIKTLQEGKDAAGKLMLGNAKSDPTVDSGWVLREDASLYAANVWAAEMEQLNPDKYNLQGGLPSGSVTFNYGDILTNAESFVETFHDAEAGLRKMAEVGYQNTDFYRDMESWIASNRGYVEEYEAYVADMDKLMAEYNALEYTTESGKKIYQIDNLKEYKEARDYLLSQKYDEQTADSFLGDLDNIKNSEYGNLQMVYKALEGIQKDTSLNMEDVLIPMYESMGSEMLNINFRGMTEDMLTELSNVVSGMDPEEISFEAILQNDNLTNGLRTTLEQAQAIADTNKLQVAIEVVSSFDPEKDLFDSDKLQKFVEQYNEIMRQIGGQEITIGNLVGMSSEEFSQTQKEAEIAGRKHQLDNVDERVEMALADRSRLAGEQRTASDNYSNQVKSFMEDNTGLFYQNEQRIKTAVDYASDIAEYNDLMNRTGELTEEEVNRKAALKERLGSKGANVLTSTGELVYNENQLSEINKLAESKNALTTANTNLAQSETNLANVQADQTNVSTERLQLLSEEASLYGINTEQLKEYSEYLRNTIPQLKGESAEAYQVRLEDAALNILKQQQGLQELSDSYSSISSTLQKCEEGSVDWVTAMSKLKNILAKVLGVKTNKLSDGFVKAAKASGLLEKAVNGDQKAIADLAEYSILAGEAIENGLITETELSEEGFGSIDEKVQELTQKELSEVDLSDTEQTFLNFATNVNTILEGIKPLNIGQIVPEGELHNAIGAALADMDGFSGGLEGLADAASQFGLTPILEPVNMNNTAEVAALEGQQVAVQTGENSFEVHSNFTDASEGATAGSTLYKIRYAKTGGGGTPSSGGGGGGGEPKKAANKRKSQTVKRYKKNDARRTSAQSAKKSASTKKDYLYGESKIAQMEKINKLAEKEAHITSDRIKESRKYMIEDRENLIKYMQKYGYEAEFDSDGFLNTYEDAWGKIHDKIAKLYEDNELTADEQKLEEDYKVELEELEGALEDYENSLKELQADIEAYEESLYEMYDNKVEQMQHKVEFKIELNEDDLSYLDFWIEALGDSLYNALESLQTMGQKTNVLFDGLDTYKQGIEDIYALSDDPLHTWATGGLDDVLTADQVDALRENRDGLMDYMNQLLELRQTMQDKVLEVFDKWQEKLESTMSTIEHYGSVMEHFRNIIDIVGEESLGLNNQFMANLEQNAINQSMDSIDATKARYDSLVTQNAEAQTKLEEAIASGDQSRIEHWEGVVQSTTEAMQEAQDSLLTSLEDTLTMIADQFESAMTRAVEAFNDAIYAHGGLQGLSDDYSLIREQADLMAEDYDKIYQLSKLNRNINKTLNDSNVIAGKQKMKSLQQEINELQASGVELSKYDLDYLQAKYELRLAELELENAKNNKDTVRLTKDSEGNWSYIYTTSVDKVDEAQQKYEDALYNMQNLSYEYMEEMSNGMMQTSLKMMEEIQALRIQDFDSYEAYAAEVQRIQDKYSGYLSAQQDELNKTVANNEELYNKDWQSYSTATGYKISADQDWADKYSETTLGTLLGSGESVSNFADSIFNLSSILTGDLGAAAVNYFANIETAMNKYGTTISGFGTTVSSTVGDISNKSKTAADDMKKMAADMAKSFKEISDEVANWQKEFSEKINTTLKEIGDLIQKINEAIQKSAELTGGKSDAGQLIGSKEAARLLNDHETYDFGEWKFEDNQLMVDGKATTFVEENAKLINAINEKMIEYTSTDSETEAEKREQLGNELKELFKIYNAFKDIVSRVYDPTTLSGLDLDTPNYSSFDTGGYTGEWGDSGKFAMLHEKELILNQDDTKNFLDALNISKDVLNNIIELNARQSSMGFGDLSPASFKDTIQSLEQQVSITAEFPNAKDHNEIEEAFSNLINQASQYANRYKL